MRYYTHFVVLLLALYLSSCQPAFEPINYDYSALQTPIQGVNQIAEIIKVNPFEPKVVHLNNGSSLSIPKEAFVDANGNTITGEVELQYKQFDNAAEIIASGIPMTYQSKDGQQQQLESGGMFELKGTANGKPVFIAPNKSIQTNLASEQVGDYDFYYLNPTATNEQYNWEKLTNEVDLATSKKGIDSFQLQWDIEKNPELAALQNIQWQLADDNPSFNPNETKNKSVLEEKWAVVSLSQPKYKVEEMVMITNQEGNPSYDREKNTISFPGYNIENYDVYDYEGNFLRKEQQIHQITDELHTIRNSEGTTIHNTSGKIIRTLPRNTTYVANEQTHQVAYITKNKELVIIDKTGKIEIQVPCPSRFKYNNDIINMRQEAKHLILSSEGAIDVFNWEGKLVNSLENKSNTFITSYYPYLKETYVQLYKQGNEKDGYEVILWDWKKNKIYEYPDEKVKTNNWNNGSLYLDKSLLIFQEFKKEKCQVWNFKTNTLTPLQAQGAWIRDGFDQYIIGQTNGETTFFDYTGKTLLTFDGSAINDGDISFDLSDDGERILTTYRNGEAKLYTKDLAVIKDFRQHDANITASFFYFDKRIITYSSTGQIYIWDYDGNLLETIQIDIQDYYLQTSRLDSTYFTSYEQNGHIKIWSKEGELLYDFGGYSYYTNSTDHFLLMGNYSNQTGNTQIVDVNTPINDSSIYQLTVTSKKNIFRTYIYLDSKTKRAYDQYQSILQTKQKKKAEAQKREQKLIRSFAINNFGIYNWDKFYKEEDELLVKCTPSFNLPEIEANQTSIFLITGENRNTVINYSSSDLDKFSFQPALYNQLLAILPDGEIAIFTDEDFKKLDIARIKSSKKHTFQMQKKDGIQALEELEKIMQVNDTAT